MNPIIPQLRAILTTLGNPPALPDLTTITHRRPVYHWLQSALQLRTTPQNVSTDPLPPTDSITSLLWTCYLNLLREKFAGTKINHPALESTWHQALQHQSDNGHLHPLTPQTLFDTFVYEELCALHAGFAIATLLKDENKLTQIRRAIHYHTENTQPDHTTTEPWALPAFATLAPDSMFADQQLHDALHHLNKLPPTHRPTSIPAALLQDALFLLQL